MGIANRDIKLENILLMDPSDRPTLKLCDFGYSKDEFMGSACKTMCGERTRLAALGFGGPECRGRNGLALPSLVSCSDWDAASKIDQQVGPVPAPQVVVSAQRSVAEIGGACTSVSGEHAMAGLVCWRVM